MIITLEQMEWGPDDIAIARARTERGAKGDKHVVTAGGHDIIGWKGERAFAHAFGLEAVDRFPDPGWDNRLPGLDKTVDVKTSARGDKLMVRAGTIKADIYVLAVALPGERVLLKGWASAENVRDFPLVKSRFGWDNHVMLADYLRPVDWLKQKEALVEGARNTLGV
jgi:hypothetical protein